MKPNKQQIEKEIEEILSYLLCHNMADIDIGELSSLVNRFHALCIISENFGVKTYGCGSYLDSLRIYK